jgi:alanine dehydrogenase
MIVGCPKEVKDHEYRVGLIPSSVRAYAAAGHTVYIQRGAGEGVGVPDEAYRAAGAQLLESAEDVWRRSEMIVKVKEPQPSEYVFMRKNLIMYTYFHFAASEELTRACLEAGITAVAYETIRDDAGGLPVLKPMSQVAGRMAPIVGAYFLARHHGGPGILPSGVPGVPPANVLVIGGGTVGTNAAMIAAGLGAAVTVLDTNVEVLERIERTMPKNVGPLYSNPENLERALRAADLVIGAVLIPGARAPKLITRKMLSIMRPSSVLVDVAIDQGGCAETSHPTTHSDPAYVVDGVTHYCVANMPGAYASTASTALNHAALPYGLEIASKGVEGACLGNPALAHGLNMHRGAVTCRPVASAFGLDARYMSPGDAVTSL